MKVKRLSNLTIILVEIIYNGFLDDRLEYDKDDLASAYKLSQREAEILYWMIREVEEIRDEVKSKEMINGNTS